MLSAIYVCSYNTSLVVCVEVCLQEKNHLVVFLFVLALWLNESFQQIKCLKKSLPMDICGSIVFKRCQCSNQCHFLKNLPHYISPKT